MKASGTTVALVALLALALVGSARMATAQGPMDLAGVWTLDRGASQFPDEIGFSADTFEYGAGARGTGARGGRRGGVGGRPTEGIRGPVPLIPETRDDSQRRRFLTDEVRLPPQRLTIAVTPASVTITPDPGAARSVQPGHRDAGVAIGPITVATTATWEEDRLTIDYTAETGRVIRYTYAVNASPRQLIVDVDFVGRGGGDKVRRVYVPAAPEPPAGTQSSRAAGESPVAAGPLPTLTLPPGALPPGTRPPVSAPPASAPPVSAPPVSAPPGSVPAAPPPSTARTAVDQRPDAPLRGLATLGLVVDGLEAEAGKCGLKGDGLETAVAKHLTDAGFRVVRNTDDETYLYVNVNAVTASAGFCVTRYDVTLYSHTAAPLAHTAAMVELQVELLHKGGLAGGAPAQNGDTVTKNILEYVDQFATRVKNVNK